MTEKDLGNTGICNYCKQPKLLVERSVLNKAKIICEDCKHKRFVLANQKLNKMILVRADQKWMEMAKESEARILAKHLGIKV